MNHEEQGSRAPDLDSDPRLASNMRAIVSPLSSAWQPEELLVSFAFWSSCTLLLKLLLSICSSSEHWGCLPSTSIPRVRHQKRGHRSHITTRQCTCLSYTACVWHEDGVIWHIEDYVSFLNVRACPNPSSRLLVVLEFTLKQGYALQLAPCEKLRSAV